MSELPMKFTGSSIVDSSRLFFVKKISKMNPFAIFSYLDSPRRRFFAELDSFESARVVFCQSSIATILRAVTFTQINSAVIKSVSIYMVNFLSARKYNPVHLNSFIRSTASIGVEPIAIVMGAPIPLHQPIVIDSIDFSGLSLRQRNKAIGWVERLGNCMSLHAVFHWSSFKGLLSFSRYCITKSGGVLWNS